MTGGWLPIRWSRTGHTRGRLILLAFVASMPIMAMAGIIAWQDYQAITRASQERAALLDGQALAQFHAAVALVAGRLSALEGQPASTDCDGADIRDASAELLGTPDVVGVVSLDQAGHIICRSGQVPELQTPVGWFEQVRGGQEIGIGTIGPERMPVLAVRTPGGDVAAVILKPGWLASQALLDATQDQETTWLLDGRQVVLAAHGAQAAWPLPPTLAELDSKGQITLRALSVSGLRYAYASTVLPGGWRLIAATSAQYEHELGVRELFIRLAELTLLLAAGLTAAVLGGGCRVRPSAAPSQHRGAALAGGRAIRPWQSIRRTGRGHRARPLVPGCHGCAA